MDDALVGKCITTVEVSSWAVILVKGEAIVWERWRKRVYI